MEPLSIGENSIIYDRVWIPRIVDKITAINSSVTKSSIPMHASMCHSDRPITSRCSMTAHPKKVRTILYERYWRVRSGSKTGSSVRSIGQQYTKNGRTGALAEAATTAAAAAPAIVPREYYTTPPPSRTPPRHPWQPLFPPTHRIRPEYTPSLFHRRSLLSSLSTNTPLILSNPFPSPFLLFAPSREWPPLLRAVATPTVSTRGVVRAMSRGRPRTEHV